MTADERKAAIEKRVEWAIAKLRTIRKLAKLGGPVGQYHHDELSEILASLRHHTEQMDRGK